MSNDVSNEKKNNPHIGHRHRMREEYIERGMEHMAPHRVLEMLLHFGIPQKDTNTLAHNLIDTFGSFSQVFTADLDALEEIKGMTRNAAVLIRMVPEINRRIVEDQLSRDWVLDTDRKVGEYLVRRFAGRTKETVMMLCLDNSSRLIACKVLGEGTAASAELSFRQVCQVAFQSGCDNIILAHNHPAGSTMPSPKDVRTTERLIKVLREVDLRLLDHFVVNETDWQSMARLGFAGLDVVL